MIGFKLPGSESTEFRSQGGWRVSLDQLLIRDSTFFSQNTLTQSSPNVLKHTTHRAQQQANIPIPLISLDESLLKFNSEVAKVQR